MGKVNISDYKDLYLKTAKEYADSLSKNCIKLAKDSSNKDAINKLHISSHSLRSQSQVMGYTELANICLNIEKISGDALKGNTQLNNQIIADIKKSVEESEQILKQVQAFGSEAQARRDDTRLKT